jgi:hypothetical protein
MLSLSNLWVMQENLRQTNLLEMIKHVRQGGLWDIEYLTKYSQKNSLSRISPLIQISRFEDNLLYLHDGHHRCVATWLAGRHHLEDSEYQIRDWTYTSYLEINHDNGWYTPFDPRIHVRAADFANFKKQARNKFLLNEDAVKWIESNYDCFRHPRRLNYLPELTKIVTFA